MVLLLLACVPDPAPKPDSAEAPDSEPLPDEETGCDAPGFADADGDGHGDADTPECGGTLDTTDCDDADPAVHPGADEHCDGVDEDCDGATDEDAIDEEGGYLDGDEDGWGDEAATACDGAGLVQQGGDCDDTRADVSPGSPEVCGDGVDEDCDGVAPGCGLPAETTSDDAYASWTPATGGGYSGASVAWMGDADGDGLDDIAVGAFSAGWQKGAVYLAPGSLAGARTFDEGLGAYAEDVDSDYMGEHVAYLGDFDGDGVGDVLASAELADWNGATAGGAWILPVSGSGTQSPDDGALARLAGEGAQDRAGGAVAAAGDVDGDGTPDALVGAYTASTEAGEYSGAGYLVLGGPGAAERDLADADARLLGEGAYNNAGAMMAGDDLDGDGLSDVAMGAYRGRSTGVVYVFTGPVAGTVSGADADAIVAGTTAGERLGELVVAPGDLDGDGRGELVVGAKTTSAWVLFGPVATGLAADAAVSLTASVAMDGGVGAADLDGDTVADLAVGLRNADAVLVLAGPLAPGGYAVDSDAAYRFQGVARGTNFGKALAVGGDVNGDGAPDLVVGATHAAAEAGVSWIFTGAP